MQRLSSFFNSLLNNSNDNKNNNPNESNNNEEEESKKKIIKQIRETPSVFPKEVWAHILSFVDPDSLYFLSFSCTFMYHLTGTFSLFSFSFSFTLSLSHLPFFWNNRVLDIFLSFPSHTSHTLFTLSLHSPQSVNCTFSSLISRTVSLTLTVFFFFFLFHSFHLFLSNRTILAGSTRA